MKTPETLPEALEQIEELQRGLKSTQNDADCKQDDLDTLQSEIDDLKSSATSPAELLAFADKWAKLRNGFIGHAACNLCFATIDHQGKRYTAHGKGILDAIAKVEQNFRDGLACRTSIQLPKAS